MIESLGYVFAHVNEYSIISYHWLRGGGGGHQGCVLNIPLIPCNPLLLFKSVAYLETVLGHDFCLKGSEKVCDS